MAKVAGLRFLIVEDHGFQRWALCNILEGLGASFVIPATDGRAALDVIENLGQPIDIVISDLDMPGMDGMEFIRHLGEAGGNTSLIVASGLDRRLVSSVETMARLYGVRLLGALEKPISPALLLSLIDRHTSGPGGNPARQAGEGPRKAYDIEEVLDGLGRKHFVPYFQPKVEMRSGITRGAEALARWRHPTDGLLGAPLFIPLLERSGHIGEFTTMMVQSAAAACRAWRALGHPITLSLNLSQLLLSDVEFADQMIRLVRAADVQPQDVIFEVTESSMASSPARALENLARLRMRGFGLSIDDFGTGYSSMQQLARIAFTELKIDRFFVTNAEVAPASRAVLESSLEIARKLAIASVAEGVETSAEWDLLRGLGCDFAQGHLVARPMSSDGFMDWIETHRVSA